MIDFSAVRAPGRSTRSITKEALLEKLTAEMVMAYYLQEHGFRALKKKFHSPFRKDPTPSAEVRYNRNGRIVFDDYGGKRGLDCFNVVMELYGIDFKNALDKIASDFGVIDGSPMPQLQRIQWVHNLEKKARRETQIKFEVLDWQEDSLDYWKRFYITKEELCSDKDVFPIGKLWIKSGYSEFGKWIRNHKKLPQFVYALKDFSPPDVYFKVYRPGYADRWLSNCPNNVPFGIHSLPHVSDTLIITKSYKDMKVLRKFHADTCATQNESEEPVKAILQRERNNYSRILLWFDGDETGIRVANELRHLVNKVVTTPLRHTPQIKDPADFIERYGIVAMKQLVAVNVHV